MNQCFRTSQYRALSHGAEDASSDGVIPNNAIQSRESLMTSIVKAASVFNNVLLENCGICTFYCDKQVQYEEYVQQQYDVGTGAMGHLYSLTQTNNPASSNDPNKALVNGNCDNRKVTTEDSDFVNPANPMNTPPNNDEKCLTTNMSDNRMEVERYYREFLFDEESVVRSVGSRGAADDEE